MTNARDRIVGPLKDKLPDVSSSDELDDATWTSAEAAPTDEFKVEIQVGDDSTRKDVVKRLEDQDVPIGSDFGRSIKTRATAEQVFTIAETDDVEKVFEELPTELHAVSEGVSVSNADTVQSNGLTGSGVKAAIIDLDPDSGSGFWPETHKDYGNNVVGKLSSGPDDGSYFVESSELHGTGCTEIVHDMAPDADLVLAAYDGSDSDGDIPSMLEKIEKNHPDTAVVSISLGSAPTDRLDGQDSTSLAIEDFTTEGKTVAPESEVSADAERGRVCAISAGNEADGNVWHGQYTDSGDGSMVFEDGEDYLEIQNAEVGTYIIANWDSWDESGEEYSVSLYSDSSKSSSINSSGTQVNWAFVQIPSGYSGDTLYFEVVKENASRDHEFDVWLWGNVSMEIAKSKADRSISIPATTRDDNTLTTAALQATDYGIEASAGDLKSYSSRGPTRDSRDGIDIAGPSRVTQTDQGYGTASGTADPGYGFNGTSAAAPHIAGAATQLFERDGVTHEDVATAIQNNGGSIPDSLVSKSDTTIVGGGYLDVEAANAGIEPSELVEPLSTKWTSNDLGKDAQYNTPAVDSNHAYVGGLQNTFYALSRDDGESVQWSKDRGNKAGLSDSSAHIWTDPSQNKVIFGSGQGKVYAVDTDDATEHWSGQDIPDLGTAVTSSPTSYNGDIFVGTNDGRVFAWAGDTATKQWETSVDGAVYSDLVAANGRLYVTTENGTLHALDTTDGTELWKATSLGDLGSSSPTVGGGRVYVAGDEVHAFDESGSKTSQWATSGYGGTAGSNPIFNNGTLYVGSADGDLYEVDASSGSQNWTFSTGDAIAGSPAVNGSGDRIAVASMDGTLYLVDSSGAQMDAVSIPSDTRASPTIDNGAVFLPTASGVVHAFE